MQRSGWVTMIALPLMLIILEAADACSSFDQSSGAVDDAAAERDTALDVAARLDSGDVDASADTGVGVCEGHTYCWTFDEPDASVSSTELALEQGGVGGSKCLRIAVDADAVGTDTRYRESLYASVLRKGPPRRALPCDA